MSIQRETFDRVPGVWKTVTRADQIQHKQRIRYYLFDMKRKDRIGYTNHPSPEQRVRFAIRTRHGFDTSGVGNGHQCMFDDKDFKLIQAWFPTGKAGKVVKVKQVKPLFNKVAKVTIGYDFDCRNNEIFHFIVKMNGKQFIVKPQFGGRGYKSRSSALRGAKRFCQDIGYEMELV